MILEVAIALLNDTSLGADAEGASRRQVQFDHSQRRRRDAEVEVGPFRCRFAACRPVEEKCLDAGPIDKQAGLFAVEVADQGATNLEAELAQGERQRLQRQDGGTGAAMTNRPLRRAGEEWLATPGRVFLQPQPEIAGADELRHRRRGGRLACLLVGADSLLEFAAWHDLEDAL